jgi:hypothetical protein
VQQINQSKENERNRERERESERKQKGEFLRQTERIPEGETFFHNAGGK